MLGIVVFFFFQAEDGIRDDLVTGVQTCALPISQLAVEMTKIVEHECRALGIDPPRLSIEPGRAIVGPAMCTIYTVGTVKRVELDGGGVRTYVSVDGGMSDNIRTALYGADFSCTIASRESDAPPALMR